MTTKKRVAIIGAGVSGLVSIKSCLEEDGLEPTCFERHDKLGGLWYHTPELRPEQGGAVYDSLVTIISKEMISFSDFPFPKEYPPYFGHRLCIKYLQEYAAHFDLEKYIKFDTKVTKLEKHDGNEYWRLQLLTSDGTASVENFDHVMVCTGTYSKASTPVYPGQENFKGIQIHGNEYRESSRFKGKKVLVVGGSYTGCDISSEVARNGGQVYLSMRHGVSFFPRIGRDGMPCDMAILTRSVTKSPSKLFSIVQKLYGTRVCDQNVFGLQSKDVDPTHLDFLISDDMQDRVAQGQITRVVGIKEFQNNDVILKDGTTLENVDAVIFATGYQWDVPLIDKQWIYDESDNVVLYKYIFPARLDNPERLALIDTVSVMGPRWPVAEIHARLAARVFAGKIGLPDRATMRRETEQRPTNITGNKASALPFPTVIEDAAEFLGVKPSFWWLLLKDPKLAMLFEYGPMVPYWYRLQGPGAWSGARDRIVNAQSNTISALKGRQLTNIITIGLMGNGCQYIKRNPCGQDVVLTFTRKDWSSRHNVAYLPALGCASRFRGGCEYEQKTE